MRTRDVAVLLLITIGCFLQTGCSKSDDRGTPQNTSKTTPIQVYASNYPLKYFTERIGGEHVAVNLLAPPDIDPAHWIPDPESIAAFQGSDLILFNGAGYERWAQTASLPKSKLCVTSDRFTSTLITQEERATHSHGLEGEHAHGRTAFTTWLDPTLAIEQAEAIQSALSKLQPQYADSFRQGFERLKVDLEVLDRDIAALVAKAPAQRVIFSHPVYQYLQRRYNLKGISVEWEPDELPTDLMWDDLKESLETHPAQWMIWEGKPLPETTNQLTELGLTSIVFDPCSNTPEEGDYLAAQHSNLASLSIIYSEAQ